MVVIFHSHTNSMKKLTNYGFLQQSNSIGKRILHCRDRETVTKKLIKGYKEQRRIMSALKSRNYRSNPVQCFSQSPLATFCSFYGALANARITNISMKSEHSSPGRWAWRSTFTGLHSREQVTTFKPQQALPCATLWPPVSDLENCFSFCSKATKVNQYPLMQHFFLVFHVSTLN